MERIDSQIQKELNDIIAFELKDPRLYTMVTITGVQTAKDLKTAKVYVSVLPEESADEAIAALKGANGFIRTQLFARLNIRMVPRFTFIADTSAAHGYKIEKILKELNAQKNQQTDIQEGDKLDDQ